MSDENYFHAYNFFRNKLINLESEQKYYYKNKELIEKDIQNVKENLTEIINLIFKEGITYDPVCILGGKNVLDEITKKIDILKTREEDRKKYSQMLREQMPTNDEVCSKNEFSFVCEDVIITIAFDRSNVTSSLYTVNPNRELGSFLPTYFYKKDLANVMDEIMKELKDIREKRLSI